MITLDGKEGGGQILRTALGLSVLTQKPFKLTNIRSNRPKPGLKEQHIQCIQATTKLCDAEVQGNYFNSQEIEFKPNPISQSNLNVKIGTAGSQALVLQTLLIASINHELKIDIIGGATNTFFAPPISHMQHIFYPLLEKMDYKISTKITKHGFYPKGGAESTTEIKASKLRPLNIIDKGTPERMIIITIASKDLGKAKVAGRLVKEGKTIIGDHFSLPVKAVTSYVESENTGCGLQMILETSTSIFGADGLGKEGDPAEEISKQTGKELIEDFENGSVDHFTADMLLPYIGLAGGSYKAPKITNHIKTSIKVIEQFLDVKFTIEENVITAKSF